MKILVALDGSDASFNALRSACSISARSGAYLTVFYVNKGHEYTPEETGWISIGEKISDELEARGQHLINKAYEIGRTLGASMEGVISYGIPAQEIMKYASEHGIIKLITMGHSSKGKGAQEFVESTTKNVVTQSKAPVFVTSSDIYIRRILITVDETAVSKKVTMFGGKLAKSLNADISIISVVPDAEAIISEYTMIAEVPNVDKYIERSEKELQEIYDRTVFMTKDILASINAAAPVNIKRALSSDEILSEARDTDLLIVATKGDPSQKKPGSTANKLLNLNTINTIFVQ